MSYRIAFDIKKIVSYFKKAEKVVVQHTDEGYFITDGVALFHFVNVPYELKHLTPPEKDKTYQIRKGDTELIEGGLDCLNFWKTTWGNGEKTEIKPTKTLLEPEEGKLFRELKAEGLTVCVNKRLLDTLSTYVGDLESDYSFFTAGKDEPVGVMWGDANGYQAAIFMPYITRYAIAWER